MLEEYFDNILTSEHIDTMSGVNTIRFSMTGNEVCLPQSVRILLPPLHFEALFCFHGTLTLKRKNGDILTIGRHDILLLSDASKLESAVISAPLDGVLVAVDAHHSRQSLLSICRLLGQSSLNTGKVKRHMESCGGYTLCGSIAWRQSVFDHLNRLSPAEQARYCVLKSVEMLYLLCVQEKEDSITLLDDTHHTTDRTISMVRQYMVEHLDRQITIAELCRKFFLSSTTLKTGFRRMYGKPVHTWLREFRMERAAEMLRHSSLSVLEVANSVGYESTSQFGVAFRKQYGITPGQFRKMSKSDQFLTDQE